MEIVLTSSFLGEASLHLTLPRAGSLPRREHGRSVLRSNEKSHHQCKLLLYVPHVASMAGPFYTSAAVLFIFQDVWMRSRKAYY